MTLDLTWLGCDLTTGKIIEELPELAPSGPISSVLATATSAAFVLPIPAAPQDWPSATLPGRTMIVAVLAGTPIWAGPVLTTKAGTSPTADISCVSIEGYLDRRYVTDHSWTQQDQASVIAAGLLADANTEGIGLLVDAPATGRLRDRTYLDRDDKTVYSALRELMAVINGPEWAIQLGWTDATQTAVAKTATVRTRIGIATTTPNAIFDTEAASCTRYDLVHDYTAGKGANHVVAVSSGQGDTRPQSDPARDDTLLATGWPRWEHRYSPSTSITDTATLTSHATSALQLLRLGARSISITARADTTPRLGSDWNTGDDIGYHLTGHAHPSTPLVGTARCIGWRLDAHAGQITPLLLIPGTDDDPI